MEKTTPCAQCPWRLSNQGKKHKFGFYTKKNLLRLWNEVRGGGQQQSCHLTDPGHPDHIAVGTKPGAKAQECPGSVILIRREFKLLANEKNEINKESMVEYFKKRKKGLTKHGVIYWVMNRLQMGHVPFFGDGVLPEVDVDDEEIGLPKDLQL